MSEQMSTDGTEAVVEVLRSHGASGLVLVCEHASRKVPESLDGLGLSAQMQRSHAAWDPGALGVARKLSVQLDAPLVAGGVSRLVYDCNRPPEAASAVLTCSEGQEIPGNLDLTVAARAERVTRYYRPFEAALHSTIDAAQIRALITVHSFTPVYLGKPRSVEIGILHDADARLADAMLATADQHTSLRTERNAPYGPQDGVTHTLRLHGLRRGIPNVMLEIRNDLIATAEAQDAMAQILSGWITQALVAIEVPA